MKLLAACIGAIALILRAAPICAAPIQTETIVMMVDCEGAPNHHDGQRGQKSDDAARSCHACTFPPVAIAALTQPARVIVLQNLVASEQLAGRRTQAADAAPARARHKRFFQHIIGVES